MTSEIIALVGGIIGGAVSGSVAAYVTAQAQVKTERIRVDAELKTLREARAAELEDKEAAERGAAAALHRATLENLSDAAQKLVAALKTPDVMRRNVSQAKAAVNAATSPAISDPKLKTIASRLSQASLAENVTQAESVLADLHG